MEWALDLPDSSCNQIPLCFSRVLFKDMLGAEVTMEGQGKSCF
jgi:hypothetical protein